MTVVCAALCLACGGSETPRTPAGLQSGLVAETVSAAAGSHASAAAVDGDRAYLAGGFAGRLEGAPAGAPTGGAFVASVAGGRGWPKLYPASAGEQLHVPAMAASRELVVIGLSRSSGQRPPATELLGLGPDGSDRWRLELAHEVGFAMVRDLAIGDDGTVYAVGSFTGVMSIAGTTLRAAGLADGFIIAVGSDGKPLWAQRFGGAGGDVAASVAVGPGIGIVVTGWFSGEAAVGRATLASNDDSVDALMARFRADGALLWARSLGGGGTDTLTDVTVRGDQIAAIGTFDRALLSGIRPIQPAGSSDILLVGLSRDAEPSWLLPIGGKGLDLAAGIAYRSDGRLVVGGQLGAPLELGGQTIDGSFYADFDPGSPPSRWAVTAVEGDVSIATVAGGSARAVIAVTTRGTASFTGGSLDGHDDGTAAAIVPPLKPRAAAARGSRSAP